MEKIKLKKKIRLNPVEDKDELKPISITKNENEVAMENFFETTIEEIEEFEIYSKNKSEGYKVPGFKTVEDKLEGLESGLYLFAAESNVGKSAVMMNMLFDIATCNKNSLYGLYYTLDDSKNEIIPRVLAMTHEFPISVASKPVRFENIIAKGQDNTGAVEEYLDKREDAIEALKEQNENFKIIDSNTVRYAEDIYDHIKKVSIFLKYYDKKPIIAIDALNDIRFRDKNFSSERERNDHIARTIKEWTVEFDVIIFGSIHLRKLNANRRPTLDDAKESVEYIYEASVVWLLHNDVSKNENAAKVFYADQDYDEDEEFEKRPIIEFDWAKNKKSSYKGTTFFKFVPEYSKIYDIAEEEHRVLRTMLDSL